MKNVIIAIVSVGIGLAAVAGAYQFGLTSANRFEWKDGIRLDKRTGRMWFIENERLFEHPTNGETAQAGFKEVPQEVVASLAISPWVSPSTSDREVSYLTYNPSRWWLRRLRVKVTSTGPNPDQNWARIYDREAYIPAEGQEVLGLGINRDPTANIEIQVISGKGYLID